MLTDALQIFKSKLQSAFNSSDPRAKIQDSDFIVSLIYAVSSAQANFTLAELRLSLCSYLGIAIGNSAFNECLATRSLVTNLRRALASLMGASAGSTSSSKKLAAKLGVTEIVGIDASMVALWDGLSKHFKGTFMTAAGKLHLAMNLVSGMVRWFALTPGSTHDSRRFLEITTGHLYIFDLGYWSLQLLKQISENSSRVVGFWNKKSRSYHWYLTNLLASRALISDLYRLR